MAKNPFENFYPVPSAEELIDIAFGRSSKKTAPIPQRFDNVLKAKRNEVNRIQNVNSYIVNRIKNIIQSVPNLDELHPFYQELSHLLVDKEILKNNLGRLNGIIPVLQKLLSSKIREINQQTSSNQCSIVRRQYYARVASVIKAQKNTLEYLEKARRQLKSIPVIDTELPAAVIAGYPNVGKSSLVRAISTAKPQIREYPFTTKEIIIGLYKDAQDTKLFQLIDTPGILDRPMIERNHIEKKAILALRTISNIIIFIFDPSKTSGYSIHHQISLFKEILHEFINKVGVPCIIIFNKMDLATDEEMEELQKKIEPEIGNLSIIRTNAKDKKNLELLIEKILDVIKDHGLFELDLSKFR
ncbi:MAG: 50S ribosome-binding GTPase [Candidatus Lokiarchaeota archaeon]|nr:50S ribosome-binding GTPase [Candidatus Lokiarchaeota archaeon]